MNTLARPSRSSTDVLVRPPPVVVGKLSPREESLFAEVLLRPAALRGEFLDEACGPSREMRGRIDALLAGHENSASLLAPIVLPPGPAIRPEERAGDRFGRYKLLLKIGEGGCGLVFMAEQQEPVRRRVALKVIKAGMDTREVIARFNAERQALALMDHPGICKVFDAGATDAGRPFFVMELVRGVPITRYCDENQLPTRARLDLFMQVCHAVQHAHQKGIIHRDLKPSNILVTVHDGAPAPKVIDFGIAKATQGQLTDATLVTVFEQFMGTPAYMAPEQAELSALDVDTRTDVYSLGVLLYELLTGRPPFDPKSLMVASRDELRRIIREVEPPKPSTHLSTLAETDRSTVAQRRGTDPTRLRLMLAGDLDWIVMKALEKNRTRRYDTPVALAEDLSRHLRHEPVLARPPGKIYRARKFVRRHQAGVTAIASVGCVLVTGTVVSSALAVRALRAEKTAVQERARADSLLDYMIGGFRTEVQKAGNLQLLEKVDDKARADLAASDPLEASNEKVIHHAKVLRQVGELRLEQARYDDAVAGFRAAYDLMRTRAHRHPTNSDMLFERAQAEFYLGLVHRRQGDLIAAHAWLVRYRESGEQLVRLDPLKPAWQREFISGLHNLAVIDLDTGQLAAARQGLLTEKAMLEKLAAAHPEDRQLRFRLADVDSWLGTIAERSGDLPGAADQFDRQIKILDTLVADEPLNARWRVKLADALALRATVLAVSGRRAESLTLRTHARRLIDELVAQDLSNRAWLTESLAFRVREAMVLKAEGDLTTATQRVAEARGGLEKLAKDEPSDRRITTFLAMAWRVEAELRLATGRADAMEAARRAQAISGPLVQGTSATDLLRGEHALAGLIAGRIAAGSGDRVGAAEQWRQAADTLLPLVETSHHWRVLDPAARLLAHLGRAAESRAVIERLRASGYVPLDPWPDASLPSS